MIDVDCNLIHEDLRSISSDPSSALSILSHGSTLKSNIIAVLSPSSTVKETHEMLSILSETPSQSLPIKIKTTAGIHPYHAPSPEKLSDDLSQLQTIFSNHDDNTSSFISCVGECGLDYSEGFPPLELQRPCFDGQLDLAFRYRKPLFLHERLAFEDTLRAID